MTEVALTKQTHAPIDFNIENRERNSDFIYPELDRTGTALNLPQNILKTADIIYRRAAEAGFTKSRGMKTVAAAALYAACRGHNIPVTIDEISKVSGVERRKIGRAYKFLVKFLELMITPPSPIEYVQRLCTQLNLDKSTRLKAVEIIKQASEQKLMSGKRPTGIAAAAAYIASILCDNRKTQQEVAQVAGISEVTIRNNFKELNRKLGIGLVV